MMLPNLHAMKHEFEATNVTTKHKHLRRDKMLGRSTAVGSVDSYMGLTSKYKRDKIRAYLVSE